MKTFRLEGPAVITNERQYAVAQAELQRFEKATVERQEQGLAVDIDPRIGEAVVDSLRGQAETLRDEVKRYEDLPGGRIGQRELGSDRDSNFAVAGNFKRIDPGFRPVSEIPEDELMRGVGE